MSAIAAPACNATVPIPARTVAATKARRIKHAQKLALALGMRLHLLPDEWLATLARVILDEINFREATAS